MAAQEQERLAKLRQRMPIVKSPYTRPGQQLEILEELRPVLGEEEFKRQVEPIAKEVAAACRKLKELGFATH